MVHNDKMISWVPVPWDGRGGRVSLAGDACHPLPPRKPPSSAILSHVNANVRRSRTRA